MPPKPRSTGYQAEVGINLRRPDIMEQVKAQSDALSQDSSIDCGPRAK